MIDKIVLMHIILLYDTRNKRIIGFTLMELMVVIGIISIIGMAIGPGLKKTYQEFKINETLDITDILIKSLRSYYLIYNEFPKDGGCNNIPFSLSHFLSSYLFKREIIDGLYFGLTNHLPYGDDNSRWDFQNWLTLPWSSGANGYIYLSIGSDISSWLQFYLGKCSDIYKTSEVRILGNDVIIGFPEFPQLGKLDSGVSNEYGNRYY